jgi:hypothetical protein
LKDMREEEGQVERLGLQSRRHDDDGESSSSSSSSSFSGRAWKGVKVIVAASALFVAVSRLAPASSATTIHEQSSSDALTDVRTVVETDVHRRLQAVDNDKNAAAVPTYMQPMMKDLQERKKLFADTPPEEVKYWFEYTGPLQVSLVSLFGRCVLSIIIW